MNIDEQLKALGATKEWIVIDDNGDSWWVNDWLDGYELTKMNSDVFLSRPVLQYLAPLPGLKFAMTRERYWELKRLIRYKAATQADINELMTVERGNG